MATRFLVKISGLTTVGSTGSQEHVHLREPSCISLQALGSRGLQATALPTESSNGIARVPTNCTRIKPSKASEETTAEQNQGSSNGSNRKQWLQQTPREKSSRRLFVSGVMLAAGVFTQLGAPSWAKGAADGASSEDRYNRIEQLLGQAVEAWERGLDPTNLNRFQDLFRACDIFDQIVALDPDRAEWLEARGQVEVDAKRFHKAIDDFNEALRREPSNYRAYASRALAYEGLAQWGLAVGDYSTALRLGQEVTGGGPEPYVMNSRGNAFLSEGRYQEALQDYDESVRGFQAAKELDGAIYAASNAALVRIQLGDEKEGIRELAAVARRAPASIDMRAALAAIYWSQGKEQKAEEEWNFACEKINAGQVFDGCAKYRDQDWLRRIRRWPPIMAQRMDDFLRLKSSPQ